MPLKNVIISKKMEHFKILPFLIRSVEIKTVTAAVFEYRHSFLFSFIRVLSFPVNRKHS